MTTRALSVTALLLAFTVLLAPAFASNVPANQFPIVNLWTTLGSDPFPSLTAVSPAVGGSFTLPSLHPGTGTYVTQVFEQANGHLVFAYQVSVDPSPPNPATADVQKLSTGNWDDSILVDAKLWSTGGGQISASGINRVNGVITMYFQTSLLMSGQTSYVMLLYTNATEYTNDTLGIQDGAGTTVTGFVPLAPTPEPATLALLGCGLATLGVLRKKFKI